MFVRDWKTNPFLTHGATLNTTVKPATRKDTECLRRMKPIRKEDACGACRPCNQQPYPKPRTVVPRFHITRYD